MYSTCTFCHAPLGGNESLEHFPVGRRLAFDQARGRLWVVCPSCRQWNLSPLETRWEAIEEAERWYRDTRRRIATDQIGLAKLRDGTELVRIGEPLRPEFAAWRYGERFTSRFKRHVAWTVGGGVALGGYLLAGPAFGLLVGTTLSGASLAFNLRSVLSGSYRSRRVAARLTDESGPYTITHLNAQAAQILPDESDPLGWMLTASARRGPHPKGRFGKATSVFKDTQVSIRGESAREAARAFLPIVNASGGRARTVEEAVSELERRPTPEDLFRLAAKHTGKDGFGDPSHAIGAMPAPLRLAMEMASHEESERRALEGELAALEAEWRAAEEIAAISDDLTLPAKLLTRLERLGSGR